MEQFSVQHAGQLAIRHSFDFDCSINIVNTAKELNKLVLVVVLGWVTVTYLRHHRSLQSTSTGN